MIPMNRKLRMLLEGLQGLLLDMDGTLYLGGEVFSDTAGFLETLDQYGIRRLFFTNNDSLGTSSYVDKLSHFGIPAAPEEILTSGHVAIDWLRQRDVTRICLLATPESEAEYVEAGIDPHSKDPEWVVLGFDTTLHYEKIQNALWHLQAGVPFLATHPDRLCPHPKGGLMDTGSMIKMFTEASGIEPAILGKPSTVMAESGLRRLGVVANQCGIVGDRLYTDMQMGQEAGLVSILVLSGETRATDLEQSTLQPDVVVSGIGEFSAMLKNAHLFS